MKKILLYIDSLYLGGAQRVMSNLADYFCYRGYNVILVNEIYPEKGRKAYTVDQDIKRIYLEYSKEQNFAYRQFERIIKLRKIVKDEKPDIVLSFLCLPNIRMLIATLGCDCKKYVSIRNDPYKEYGKGIKKFFINYMFRLADGCIFQTEMAASYFSTIIRLKSTIIKNPVHQKFYTVERKGDSHNIVFVGRLETQKNPYLLIEAFEQLAKKYKDWNLLMVGEGSLRLPLENRCKELNLLKRIIFLGQVDDVDKILSKAEVFVLPSNYEGMPNVLMEAMASGVPCISSDCPCGGPRELIEDGQNGLLVPVGNVDKLKDALELLIKDAYLRKQIGKNGRIKAFDFSPNIILKKWEEFIVKRG